MKEKKINGELTLTNDLPKLKITLLKSEFDIYWIYNGFLTIKNKKNTFKIEFDTNDFDLEVWCSFYIIKEKENRKK